jgi:hypothetical protein
LRYRWFPPWMTSELFLILHTASNFSINLRKFESNHAINPVFNIWYGGKRRKPWHSHAQTKNLPNSRLGQARARVNGGVGLAPISSYADLIRRGGVLRLVLKISLSQGKVEFRVATWRVRVHRNQRRST